MSAGRSYSTLLATVGALYAGLLVYSQTAAFCWDAGFHLLAAQLIRQGKIPYLDFCFPQTPLNAYFNAFLMTLFGDRWRPIHVVAATFIALAIFLAADFVFRRFPIPEWKLPAAVFSAILIASVFSVVAFGTVAQAYAICLVLTVAAMRLAVAAVRTRNLALVFAAGLCASASAACSMLAAASVAVIFVWLVYENRAARITTAAIYLVAAAIPFLPVLRLFIKSPQQVWFNVVQYQTLYRAENWGGAGVHDLGVFLGVSESPPALMLILLGTAGFLFIHRRGDRQLLSEFTLCVAIAIGTSAELWTAHPTFDRYFLLTVPFLAIPAAAGLYDIGTRLYNHRWRIVAAASTLALLGLASQLYDDSDSVKWSDMQQVAAKVEAVTPPNAPLFADELTYFLTGRPVPDGMQFDYAHKLELDDARARLFHILTQPKIEVSVKSKSWATLETCDEDDAIADLNLDAIYSHEADVANCKVYWSPKP